ncbi:MAG: Sir2 family NAD-dependent protein deacetylase [Sedimentisphaerales bacterium]|nr:Sir2 family NAD-dependent protein deacetylase [Sedimentisphaerales bacterium]
MEEHKTVESDDEYPSFVPGTERKMVRLAEWIHEATTVIWFTGAGISTESGLPDFRGPRGIRTRRGKKLRRSTNRPTITQAQSNAAHYAIVDFEKAGKCDFLISQNVDNLHLKSGYPIRKLAELHGNVTRVRCGLCDKTFSAESLGIDLKRSKRDREQRIKKLTHPCPTCGRPLERSVIDFHDLLPEGDLMMAAVWAIRADLIIVIGSTCMVYPAASMPKATKNNGGKVVIMNIGKTELDNICDLRFSHEKIAELLPRLWEIYQARWGVGGLNFN